jgi:hypothetical protein
MNRSDNARQISKNFFMGKLLDSSGPKAKDFCYQLPSRPAADARLHLDGRKPSALVTAVAADFIEI